MADAGEFTGAIISFLLSSLASWDYGEMANILLARFNGFLELGVFGAPYWESVATRGKF